MPFGFHDDTVQGSMLFKAPGISQLMVQSIGLTPAGGADAHTLAQALDTAWHNAHANSVLDAGWSYEGTTVRGVIGGVLVSGEQLSHNQGTATGSVPPPSVTCVVKKVTNVAGRKNGGRFHLVAGYVSEDQIDEGGIISSTQLTALQGRLDTFMANLTTSTAIGDPVILHKDESAGTIISSLLAESPVGTQRRRLHRFGR